jgi:hypothetical protein
MISSETRQYGPIHDDRISWSRNKYLMLSAESVSHRRTLGLIPGGQLPEDLRLLANLCKCCSPNQTPILVHMHFFATHGQCRLGHMFPLEYVARRGHSLRVKLNVRDRSRWTRNLHPARQ